MSVSLLKEEVGTLRFRGWGSLAVPQSPREGGLELRKGQGGSPCSAPALSQWVPAPPVPPSPVSVQGAAGMGGQALGKQGSWREAWLPSTLPGSSLTVSRVEKQLHLLPQRPDHVTMTV